MKSEIETAMGSQTLRTTRESRTLLGALAKPTRFQRMRCVPCPSESGSLTLPGLGRGEGHHLLLRSALVLRQEQGSHFFSVDWSR